MAPHKTEALAGAAVAKKDEKTRHWIMGAEAFEARMPHHDGIQALWETKWKFPKLSSIMMITPTKNHLQCTKSVYPFHDGQLEDFEPIFDHLIKNNINDGTSPAYTEAFFPIAESLTAQGDAAAADDDQPAATALYLRACTVYRIARFPYITAFPTINCPFKWHAWEAQKEVYMRAASAWSEPVEEVVVPHSHRAGRDRADIPVYVRMPSSVHQAKGPVPAVILMTGLDGYRPDNTVRTAEFITRGWAAVVVEIPGTADCPADSADPDSPDRLWSSLLDWMDKEGRFEMGRVMVWGLSSGGYYAIRIAHTHRERIVGSVAQGAGCHFFYEREWLERADGHEYPFRLTPAMAMKHGFESVEEYKEKVQKKFSLLETGIIQKPSTRLLLINGTRDGLMPIEDSMMLFEYGSPKEARFFTDALHMGYPMANSSVYPWMESVMASASKCAHGCAN
ncbi:Alpha/Beta hydrolase protein [Cercophora scortea]|uniref:Alpha/Beta hydrolase protein n=1 Tax=Cercophora scortea TaxID=314031 RepID=A0AAE0J5V0_9PEZI|nr:Alpha/Beta hydrolase protein [Cercophora scortea]